MTKLAPHGGCNWTSCRECFPPRAKVIVDPAVATMELDVTYDAVNADETIESVLAMLTEGTQAKTKIVTLNGPAVGWPVVRFTGTLKELQIVEQRMGEAF